MDVLRVYVMSYHGDFIKERETLHKQLLPDLRAWCENKRIQLMETDFRWGGFMSKAELLEIKQKIEGAFANDEKPYFINLTSQRLGLVPMWGKNTTSGIIDLNHKIKLKAEEQDILYRTFRDDLHNPHSIFLVRDDSFLETLSSEEQHFLNAQESLSGHCLGDCQERLGQYPSYRVFPYTCSNVRWDGEQFEMDMEIEVFQRAFDYIKSRVESERAAICRPISCHDQVRAMHRTFMAACGVKVKGRDSAINQLEQYIRTGGLDVPVLLLGEAGSGKTSILAKAAHQFSQPGYLDKYSTSSEDKPWLVFYHFVGPVPGSTELLGMLQRLLRELDITTDSTTPHDVDSAAQMCCSALSSGSTRPVVVIVDAVNQFDEDSASQIMSWVPRKLAPHTRCILSVINDMIQHKKLLARESKPQELHVAPLDFEARKEIVTELVSKYDQSLTRDQMNSLLSKPASENPLWLSVACEELQVITDPKRFNKGIRDMPDSLIELLGAVLARLERDHGDLLVSTLCLLEASVSGLLEPELRMLLGATEQGKTAELSPDQDKEETEASEKDLGRRQETQRPLEEVRWLEIYRGLRPYVRPYGDGREGRLALYHRAFSKAVSCRYFKVGRENEQTEETIDAFRFWHQRLADFFERCQDLDRKAEEYLQHLCHIEDTYRLSQCLCDWEMLTKLYHEEYSAKLLNFWRKAGGTEEMIRCYGESLAELESQEPKDERLVALRHELVSRIYLQGGRYAEALDLAKMVIKWEEKELGNRAERMVDLNSLMADIYEEKLKLNDFVSPSQLPDLRKTIAYARKSIELRKTFPGDRHKMKLGLSLMKLAFSLESWSACGGDESEMTGDEALQEGNDHIDKAITIFQELKDAGHYAEALMTKGVLAPRGSMGQLQFYNEAMEICRQVYGEESLLSSRLYINMGIVYEDNNDYVRAYELFRKWAEISDVVLGPDHPKTVRAKGVLREARYRLVALRLSLRGSDGLTDDEINREVEGLEESVGSGAASEEDGEEREDSDDDQVTTHRRARDVVNASTDLMQQILSDIWRQIADGASSQDADSGRPPTEGALDSNRLSSADTPSSDSVSVQVEHPGEDFSQWVVTAARDTSTGRDLNSQGRLGSDVPDSSRHVPDSNGQDSNVQDSSVQNSNVQDSNVQDSNVQDSNVQDSNVQDSNVQDIGQDSDVSDLGVQAASVQVSSALLDSDDSDVQDLIRRLVVVMGTAPTADPGDNRLREEIRECVRGCGDGAENSGSGPPPGEL